MRPDARPERDEYPSAECTPVGQIVYVLVVAVLLAVVIYGIATG